MPRSSVKAVVSHQHRYGKHYQAVKDVIAGGKIGKVHTVYGIAHGWAAHMLSHLVDYSMWFNDYPTPTWAMAQAAGKHKLADLHAVARLLGRLRAVRERRARHLRVRRRSARRARGAATGGARTGSARSEPRATPRSTPATAGRPSRRTAS